MHAGGPKTLPAQQAYGHMASAPSTTTSVSEDASQTDTSSLKQRQKEPGAAIQQLSLVAVLRSLGCCFGFSASCITGVDSHDEAESRRSRTTMAIYGEAMLQDDGCDTTGQDHQIPTHATARGPLSWTYNTTSTPHLHLSHKGRHWQGPRATRILL